MESCGYLCLLFIVQMSVMTRKSPEQAAHLVLVCDYSSKKKSCALSERYRQGGNSIVCRLHRLSTKKWTLTSPIYWRAIRLWQPGSLSNCRAEGNCKLKSFCHVFLPNAPNWAFPTMRILSPRKTRDWRPCARMCRPEEQS